MTNKEIWRAALEQSAADLNCQAEDFLRSENLVTALRLGPSAKAYYKGKEPLALLMVSFGNNIVASAQDDCRDIVTEYVRSNDFFRCFVPPALLWLDARLARKGQRVSSLSEYYLPDVDALRPLPCEYELKILYPADFSGLYTPEWGNALCADRRELDVLAVGAFDKNRLVGLAGCSADCAHMWQIGVDVLPDYRRKGIAAALVSRLALEALERGKIPFYGAKWSNLPSKRTALKSGFYPAWVELSASAQNVESEDL